MRFIKWAVEHPTIINLLMAGLCVLGFASVSKMPKEVFPITSLDMIFVNTVFRGAGPSEIEKGVLIKIEEAIQGVPGVDRITSEARENVGTVRAEIARGADTASVLRDIKDQVEQITSFPTGAEKPRVFEVIRRQPVINFALHGNLSRAALQTLAEKVKDDLLAKPGLRQIKIRGMLRREISIEIDEQNLRRYRMQTTEIARALRTANLDLSGGTIKTKKEDFLIRIYGKKYRAKELEEIVVRSVPGGTPILLRDVAKVKESFEDNPQKFYFRGKVAVQIRVQRLSTDNALEIVKIAKAYLVDSKDILPPGAKLEVDRDITITLKERIGLLSRNGLQGLLLVLLTLSLLMNLRLAFWVAAGLPLSMLGAFILMMATGISINVISLFGLILVIGILVDDAIVVSENVYSYVEKGMSPKEAAIRGTSEVAPAVLAAVFTTCLAFTPLFFMGGIMGKFIYAIPAVVVAALLFSLVECLVILPPHLAHALKARSSSEFKLNRFRKALDSGFEWVNKVIYGKSLRVFLSNRWVVLAASIGLLLFTFGLIGGGVVKFVFFPKIDGDRLVARFVMQPGTPLKETERVASRIEKIANALNDELDKKYGERPIIRSSRWIGLQTKRTPGFSGPTGEETGEVELELIPSQKRKLSSFVVVTLWRKRVGSILGAMRLGFDVKGTPPVGRALEFQLLSNDQKQLKIATDFWRKRLGSFSGVDDAEDDLALGKQELRMVLKPLAKSIGVSLQNVASQLRFRVYGQEAMKLQRGRDEIRVFVRYPEKSRKSIEQLKDLQIRTQKGLQIPLEKLVTWTYTRQLQVIRRIERKRMSTIIATLDSSKGNRDSIIRALRNKAVPELAKLTPMVKVDFAGQSREQKKVFGGMAIAFPLALFGILALLVMIFQSYNQAIIIMSMIPFGVVGAVLGHFVLGLPLTILSFFGIVGLSGVVVNDSLVLMDKVNRNLRNGMTIFDASLDAGQSRLRAILSTTLTTFVGLVPIMAEKSLQAQFLIPMAVSLAFGVLFATVITLVIVPTLFVATNDVRRFKCWVWNGYWPAPEDVEPECIRVKEKALRESKEMLGESVD